MQNFQKNNIKALTAAVCKKCLLCNISPLIKPSHNRRQQEASVNNALITSPSSLPVAVPAHGEFKYLWGIPSSENAPLAALSLSWREEEKYSNLVRRVQFQFNVESSSPGLVVNAGLTDSCWRRRWRGALECVLCCCCYYATLLITAKQLNLSLI